MARKTVIRRMRTVKRKANRLLQTPPKLKFYFGWHYKHSSVKPNRMLLESFHGKNISDSPYAVLEELMESGEYVQYEIFFSTNDMARDRAFVRANKLPVTLVDINSRRYPEVLATAKYLLNNSSFPAYFIRKPEQVYVQTWHGTPLKTLGKRMRLGMESMSNVQHNFIQASCITFPNDFTREVIMRDYNLDDLYTGSVAMVGYPRNSVFMRGEDEEVLSKYGLEGYQTFAYMPTWRGTSNHAVSIEGYKKEVEEYLLKIDQNMRADQKMFVNFHSMVAAEISLGEYEHIFPFPETVGNYDFLAQVDVLITDYSSVLFDYALTGKPIVLFAYDLEDYSDDRGFYFSIDELPFPIVRDVDSLIDRIRTGSFDEGDAGLAAFQSRYLRYDTPNNSRLVLDLLVKGEAPGVPMLDFGLNKEKEWCLFDPEQRRSLADIKTVFESSDSENDIVLLTRARFGMRSSALVHDDYRDDRNYLFITRTTPRTVIEEGLSRVLPNVRDSLREREVRRMLGDLNVVGERVSYCMVEPGRSYSVGASVELPVDVIVGEGYFAVYFPEVPGVLEKAFVARGRRFDWVRNLTQEEIDGRFAVFEAADLLEDLDLDLRRNGRYNVGVSFRHDDDGRIRVGLGVQAMRHFGRVDMASRYCKPVIVRSDELDWEKLRADVRHEYSIATRALGRGISLTPYFREGGNLGLLVRYQGEVARDYLKPSMKRVVVRRNEERIRVAAKLPSGSYEVKGALLINREDSVGINHRASCSIRHSGRWEHVEIFFNPEDYNLDGVFWDLALEIDEGYGYTSPVYVLTTPQFRTASKVKNIQKVLSDGNVLFPYSAKGKKLAFTHRPMTKWDTQVTKLKEVAAFGLFAVLHPYWTRKRMWLVYEKFCSLAQDNAFHFFEYCMNEAGPDARKFVYYVIDKESPDYANVAKYGKNVVDFMSFRHMLYCMIAKIYVASDSKPHLYQWRPKPSLVRSRISKHKIFFLQHGVTALKRVDKLFGRRGTSPMNYFLTTSKREQDIIVENFDYSPERAPILGFSRWDALVDSSNAAAPVILLMPTWRSWLEEQSDEVFLSSEYYQTYSSLIQNEELHSLLRTHNAHIKFFIHPKLSEFLGNFSKELPNVELVALGEQPLNALIMECSMLVTDYSSVCWDVLYMDKPVVFYMFDQERYINDIGAYIDLDSELPGPVCKTESDCIAAVKRYFSNGFKQTPRDEGRASEFLPIVDSGNRARTYHFLVDEGF